MPRPAISPPGTRGAGRGLASRAGQRPPAGRHPLHAPPHAAPVLFRTFSLLFVPQRCAPLTPSTHAPTPLPPSTDAPFCSPHPHFHLACNPLSAVRGRTAPEPEKNVKRAERRGKNLVDRLRGALGRARGQASRARESLSRPGLPCGIQALVCTVSRNV